MSKFKIGDVWYDAATGKPVQEVKNSSSAGDDAQAVREEANRLAGELVEIKNRLTAAEVERDDLKNQLANARQENENNVRSMNATGAQLTEVTAERDNLKKQLGDATLLPEDALERLKGVDGIGDKMAQKALEALTAKDKK